jgi:hypothetical protein
MRWRGQAQVPPVSWPWLQAMDSTRRIRSPAAHACASRALDHVQIAPLGAAVLSRRQRSGTTSSAIPLRRPRLHKPSRSRNHDDRALHGPVPLSSRTSTFRYPASRTGRFLTVADHTTTPHLPTRLRGPRRSKTEPGRQAWRFTPLQRIPNPGRSPGTSPQRQKCAGRDRGYDYRPDASPSSD